MNIIAGKRSEVHGFHSRKDTEPIDKGPESPFHTEDLPMMKSIRKEVREFMPDPTVGS